MQVTETLNEGLKRGYSIKLTAAELDEKVNEKLQEAQPDVEMKGFRKGKVPLALLKRQFGQRILGEAMQETIDGAMSKHFEDSGDRPALQPNIEMQNGEKWKEGDDVEVSMTYEALPSIPDVDFSKIKLQKLVVKSDKAAVDEALDNLASSANDFKDRKKGSKAKDGDQVVIDFLGTVDGEAFEGGAARAVMKRQLLDALDKKVKFELPPSLVEAEAKQIAHQLFHDENPDIEGHDHEEVKPSKEHNKLAERRVRLGLLLAELGQKAEVEVSDAEMTQAIMAQSRQYPGQEKEFFEFIQKNQQMQQQLRAPIFEDKVVDHIFEQAAVTDKKVDKTELQKAVEALDED